MNSSLKYYCLFVRLPGEEQAGISTIERETYGADLKQILKTLNNKVSIVMRYAIWSGTMLSIIIMRTS